MNQEKLDSILELSNRIERVKRSIDHIESVHFSGGSPYEIGIEYRVGYTRQTIGISIHDDEFRNVICSAVEADLESKKAELRKLTEEMSKLVGDEK